MKFEELHEKNNKLLERKEISTYVVFDKGTPRREEIKKELCAKVGANPDMSVLRKVETHYGTTKAKVVLHAYEDVDKMKASEPKHLLKRDGLIKEEKKEDKPAENKEESKEDKK